MVHALTLALGAALLPVILPPFSDQDPRVQSLPAYGLTITLPAQLTELQKKASRNAEMKGCWTGKLEETSVEITLYVLADEKFGFTEPDDVTEIVLENVRDPKKGDPAFWFEKTQLVVGPFGWAGYGSIGWGALHDQDGTKVEGTLLVLDGLLEKNGYSLEVVAQPALTDAQSKAVLDFFRTGVVYKGSMRNPKWTDDEARERWIRDAPKATHVKLEKPIRTEHYVVLTNSSGGKKFAEAMEKSYGLIRKTYPFDDVAGTKLMPVFLFRTPDEYYEYYSKIANITLEAARRSKGHSWRDYYATWYEAPNDPVHIHEATHQIFSNRLHLGGGGSWFQEGVAEYMSTTANDRNPSASEVKKRKHVPLADLVEMKSLLYSASKDDPKGDASSGNYHEAALLIEFLRESKGLKDRFPDFLRTVGRVPRSETSVIERAVRAVYGTDLKGLENQWVEYCKKR